MALNFELLGDASAPVTNYLQGQQDVTRNQLAQQQIQTGQLNQQKAQMEMDAFKRRQAGLDQFMQKANELGVNGDPEQLTQAYWEHATSTGDPNEIKAAMIAVQTARERKAYIASQSGAGGAVATPVPTSTDTSVAKITPLSSFDEPTQTVASMPAAASVNALAPTNAPIAPTAESIAAKITNGDIRFSSVPEWKAQREILMKQYDQLIKPPSLHVVEGSLVGPDGKVIYKGENTAKQRLEFDQRKFDYEKANPGYEVKEVPQANGTIKLVGVNKRTNEAVPITMSGKELVSPNLAAQRLSFDQSKFNWEKANPGKTIKEVPQADGTMQFFAIDNRTGSATPVMMGGAAGATPAGGGRGSVGVTDNQGAAGTPLVGASSKGLTETQGNATAFGMRMKDSSDALKNLENKGATNTGVIGGTVGGVVGLVPLIGDKLTAGVDNIYNVLPQVMGGYSPEQQQILNGRINFVTALLRKESGAAISPTEFATAEKLYFPRPGDDATVIKQKQNARDLAIKAMKVQAGPGAKAIDEVGSGTGEWKVVK